MKMCKSCQSVNGGEQDLSCHPSLITIYSKEKCEEIMDFLFFCKDCFTLLNVNISIEDPMNDEVKLFNENMNEELIHFFALALWAEHRREQVEQRKSFLKHRLMPIYEPIEEREYNKVKETKESNVVKTPYFPQWHDNIEDALNSFDEEDEWDDSFSFSYAEPIDLHMISSNEKAPRFFRTYLIPADEMEAMLRIEMNESNRLSVWKQTVSRIEKISIWDEKEGRNIDMDTFLANYSESDLWMKFSKEKKEVLLEPFKEWIRKKLPIHYVS